MGMDLYAEDHTPKDGWPEASGYFRSNIWGWRPIAAALEMALKETGRPELKEVELRVLSYNDGGLIPKARSVELADAIDEWLLFDENKDMAFVTLHGSTVTQDPSSIVVSLRKEDPRGVPVETKIGGHTVTAFSVGNSTEDGSAWTTSMDHLREFSVFSRQSGGFRVS